MIVKLHDLAGNEVPVETQSMCECRELPQKTELEILQRVHGLSRFNRTHKVLIQVKETKADIRKKILNNRDIIGVIPICLTREKITFEQLRAERRKREAEAIN